MSAVDIQKLQTIAAAVFVVNFTTLPSAVKGLDPRQDGEILKQGLGDQVLRAYRNSTPQQLPHYDELWQNWHLTARNAGVTLPYQGIEKRFSGDLPSYLAEESRIIQHLHLSPLDGVVQTGRPTVLSTLAPSASGKSKRLARIRKEEFPYSYLSDPDDGVLESFGPYLLARRILRDHHIPAVDGGTPSLEKEIVDRNRWRMPPYKYFRAMSNAVNTEGTGKAFARGLDIAFGWTGIRGYGLNVLVKQGYQAGGYRPDFLMMCPDLETRTMLEAKRERPCDEKDFVVKAPEFIAALPDTLGYVSEAGGRLRLFDLNITDVQSDRPARMIGDIDCGHPHVLAGMVGNMRAEQWRLEGLEQGKAAKDVAAGIAALEHFTGVTSTPQERLTRYVRSILPGLMPQ